MAAVSLIWGMFFTMVLQGVDGLSRSPCTREANFNNSIKGYSLDDNVLATLSVNNAANCVISCLHHPECQSVNFHVPANPEHVCELNSKTDKDVTLTVKTDVIHYGPTQMPNCALDGPGECQNGGQCAMSCSRDHQTLMCHCPAGRTGPTCQDKSVVAKNQDFVMVFPAMNIEDYILLDNTGPEMSNFTVLSWINRSVKETVALFTYSDGSDTETRITFNCEMVYFRLQNIAVNLPIPPICDGYWHHMAFTWSLGKYSAYLDGALIHTGNGLGSPIPITGGGTFHIGQRLRNDGTYYGSKSFQGKLSQFNVWNEILTSDEIKSMSKSCYNNVGNVLDWSTVVDAAHGAVNKEKPGDCEALRNNPFYDIVMSANASESTADSYILSTVNLLTFNKLTISAWVKHSEYVRYVEYKTVDGQTALSFALHKDVLILQIAGADTKQARVPRYWKESPAYWHHIATTWSSQFKIWKIYLDGSLVSYMRDVASGIQLPTQGELFMGLGNPDNGDLSMDGGLSRLNIWDYTLQAESLSIMATKGPLFENGNVFAWYGVKSKVVGNMTFQKTPSDLFNSRANSEYQMTFPAASYSNYVLVPNVFSNPLTTLAACFWAKILTYSCSIYAYSTTSYDAEFQAYIYSYELELQIHEEYSHGPHVKHGEWHFYCQQWRSSDGLVETWQDAIKLADGNSGVGAVLEPGGTLVLGQEPDSFAGGFSSSQAYKGSLADLNFWTEFLTANEIQGMAAGSINVNGNLFQWRAYRSYTYGAVTVEDKSDSLIPEYRVQKGRDSYCKGKFTGTHARFVCTASNGYSWRCIDPVAMLPENMCYNIPLSDSTYHSNWEADILAIV